MNKKSLGVSLGSAIFILFLVAVLALVRPVYLRIYEALSDFETVLSKKLEDETGLALSYASLSPSVFTGVNFRNISIHEVATQNKLLSIRRATLTYDIKGFFSKNPTVALKELTLNGVSIEYNAMQNQDFIEKIKLLIEKRRLTQKAIVETAISENSAAEVDFGEETEPENKADSDEELDFDIPLDVVVKNVSVHYSDKQNDVLATLKNIKFKDFSLSEGIELETSGKVFYKTALYKTAGRWTSVACNFSVS